MLFTADECPRNSVKGNDGIRMSIKMTFGESSGRAASKLGSCLFQATRNNGVALGAS